jgi:hypothetical protein
MEEGYALRWGRGVSPFFSKIAGEPEGSLKRYIDGEGTLSVRLGQKVTEQEFVFRKYSGGILLTTETKLKAKLVHITTDQDRYANVAKYTLSTQGQTPDGLNRHEFTKGDKLSVFFRFKLDGQQGDIGIKDVTVDP